MKPTLEELFAAVLLRKGRPAMEMRFRILRQVWKHYHATQGEGMPHGKLANRCAYYSKGAIFEDCIMDLINNGYMYWEEESRTVRYYMTYDGDRKMERLLSKDSDE